MGSCGQREDRGGGGPLVGGVSRLCRALGSQPGPPHFLCSFSKPPPAGPPPHPAGPPAPASPAHLHLILLPGVDGVTVQILLQVRVVLKGLQSSRGDVSRLRSHSRPPGQPHPVPRGHLLEGRVWGSSSQAEALGCGGKRPGSWVLSSSSSVPNSPCDHGYATAPSGPFPELSSEAAAPENWG